MNVMTISPRDLNAKQLSGEPIELLDVRTPVEYREIHCPFAKNIPLTDLDPKAMLTIRSNPAEVPLDTSAAAVVVEQLARLAILPALPPEALRAAGRAEAMVDALLDHLTPLHADDRRPAGMLLDGCFNQPKRYANRSELIWGTAYLLFALYYLKTGRVVE